MFPNDLVSALRMLRRSPGYALTCIAVLALGIGANAAIFSVIYSVILKPLDASVNTLTYSCPASMDLQRVKTELDAGVHKAGFLNIAEDKSDPANPVVTARKSSQWVRWTASSEAGVTTYSLTVASGSSDKFKAEACASSPVLSPLKQCEVSECASKAEDSVAMRTAQKEQTSLTGAVQTITLACPLLRPEQTFSTLESELMKAGFEILFSEREHPEKSGWMTARAGKRWVEMVSVPDGESVGYALTLVPSAEVLTAAKPEPKSAPEPTPAIATAPTPKSEPEPQPKPLEATPIQTPTPAALPVITPAETGFVPPKLIIQVPIEPTRERIHSVIGAAVIDMLVDVDENGSVTRAEFTGKITNAVLRLESAALEALWKWRFEPARQDGRIVPAAKIAVRMTFQGRP